MKHNHIQLVKEYYTWKTSKEPCSVVLQTVKPFQIQLIFISKTKFTEDRRSEQYSTLLHTKVPMNTPGLVASLALAGSVVDLLRGSQSQLQDITGHRKATELGLGGPPAFLVGEPFLLYLLRH